jgi:hypothetical protein
MGTVESGKCGREHLWKQRVCMEWAMGGQQQVIVAVKAMIRLVTVQKETTIPTA